MSHSFTLSYELYLPRELVFETWTDASHLGGWYAARGESVVADGAARWRLVGPAAEVIEDVRVVETQAPERLLWERVNGPAGGSLSVTFGGGRGTCTIEVSQSSFADAAERDRQEALWQQRLRRLEEYFSAL